MGGYYDAPVALVRKNGTTSYYSILRDHLGSITRVIASNQSNIYGYDAWGRMRNFSMGTLLIPENESAPSLGRGFCGHEHLTGFGLINMNARLYDPMLGRFLSPDPYVQAPEHSQSFNRYSYCMNNPLRYTDITGEWFGLDDLIASVVGGIVNLGINLLSGNIHSIGQGISSFALGAAAGELALYGQVGTSAFLVGAGNSIINQGFTNGWNYINWMDAVIAGGMSMAFSAISGKISSIYSKQIENVFGGISNDVLRNTLSSGTINSLTGFTIESGLTLANGGNLSDALNAGLEGAGTGFVTGAISGFTNSLNFKRQQSQKNTTQIKPCEPNDNTSFFEDTQYSDKVQLDIKKGDYHSFPESVTAFEMDGVTFNKIGGDGNLYKHLHIPGWYKGKYGNFEFIKDRNGVIWHRFFNPTPKY